MGRLVLQEDISNDNLNPSPRVRKNRTVALTLTTAFQTIDFNGASNFNVNTFPKMASGKLSVDWDSTNKKFVFNSAVDRNYDLTFYYHLTATLTGVDVWLRFCVPVPNAPLYFPFPDGRGYKNLATTQSFTDFADEYTTIIYATEQMRTYGLQVQIRQAGTLLNMPVLADCAMLIYGA